MNDYEYIKNEFDHDGVKAPESLSADHMRQLIRRQTSAAEDKPDEQTVWEKIAHEPKKTFWTRQLRYGAALAACLVMALIVIPAARKAVGGDVPAATENDDSRESASAERGWNLKTFKNEKELKTAIDKANSDGWGWIGGNRKDASVTVEEAVDSEATAQVANDTVSDADNHAETYKQVEGVDEADIIKTDGEYIYHVNGDEEIDVFRAADGKANKVSTISRFDEDGSIDSIYLDGNTLVSVGYIVDQGQRKSAVAVYDISDRAKPEKKGHFEQSGSILSSRMTKGIIYLVSRDNADYRRLRPYATKDGEYDKVEIADIAAFPNFPDASYAVISAIDCRSGKKMSSVTKAILGVADDIYCNQEHLYLACRDYSGNKVVTRILKTDLNDGKLEFAATGKVRGEVYGQFAMDEKDGDFRIATTSERNGEDVNNLFILDEDLNLRGRVTGFARGEEIKAVRFIGKKAYVITYENTDPLFVLDISDPDDPQIDGEVKIDGFSSLLVPLDEDHLIGVGYITGRMDEDEGVKLALFDVSDPARPKVLDEKEFESIESAAQYDHHALMKNDGEGYLAIPYINRDWEDYTIVEDAEETDAYMPPESVEKGGGVLAFAVDDSRIKILEDHKIREQGVNRCTYVGDYIYAVTEDDGITGFKL